MALSSFTKMFFATAQHNTRCMSPSKDARDPLLQKKEGRRGGGRKREKGKRYMYSIITKEKENLHGCLH